MSPRRWDCDKGGFMFLADEGKWVYWEDHAAALTAVEANRNLVKQLKDQRAALEAEVAELKRKYGNALSMIRLHMLDDERGRP